MGLNTISIDKKTRQDYIACSYLFSPEDAQNEQFIKNLKFDAVKKAFREKAKRYHPDLNVNDNDEMILKRQERFVKIKTAYDYLFLKLQKKAPEQTITDAYHKRKKPKIIAVGGAKGGIGKSIFTSNLSVYLSQKGYDTIAADFDLGGSNLHLYLGKPRIRKNINHFLSNKVPDLDSILEKTAYGPRLIGGDSSQLGTANISFTRKLKLLKAIRNTEADFVIVDLGGDTSYNVLDFFLAADFGIVMTTCDPASYLDAYSFIKVALYRKLNRLFGPESMYAGKSDHHLKHIINETLIPKGDRLVGDIEKIIKKIKQEYPSSMETIRGVLSDFTPQMIVNKITDEKTALEPVRRIQDVSRKKLSITVEYLCSFPFEKQIEKSARTLVPWIFEKPEHRLAQPFNKIFTKILHCG